MFWKHRITWVTGEFTVFHFDQVHNYYERLVFERVMDHANHHSDFTSDMLADVACIALNKLPPKYVRHEVDLVFYRTDAENDMMHANLDLVIKLAYETVAQCERSVGSGL